MKKLLCVVLTICCMFVVIPAFATEYTVSPSLNVAYNTIVHDVASVHNVNEELCRIVPMGSTNTGNIATNSSANSPMQKAILLVDMLPNNVVTTTLIVPFNEMPDGTLMNSFEYAATIGVAAVQSTGERTVPLYDIDASLRGTYKVYTAAILDTFHAGQLYKGGFQWTKVNSSSSAKVRKAIITVHAKGALYSVPDYVTEPSLINSNYNKGKTTTITSPKAGVWTYTPALMSTTEGVVRPNAFDDGGYVSIDVEYNNANGSAQHSYGTTLTCFSK